MLDVFIEKLLKKEVLTIEEAEAAMELLFSSNPYQVTAFLVLLKSRGETPEEVAGIARVLRKKAFSIPLPFPVLDIMGTGGDRKGTVNISTGSAILAAASGILVAKHGNRSVSSKCGSADVLEALGIRIEIPSWAIQKCLEEVGIAFLFAPLFHPTFKNFSTLRKGLKTPTIFNLLGPLLNPTDPDYLLIGVPNLSTLKLLSEALLLLGSSKRALLFSGSELDELSCVGKIQAIEIKEGKAYPHEINPEALGFSLSKLEDLKGGDPKENAALLLDTFLGKKGALHDTLILNAAACLWISQKTPTLEKGIFLATEALSCGKAYETLEKWKKFSKEIGEHT